MHEYRVQRAKAQKNYLPPRKLRGRTNCETLSAGFNAGVRGGEHVLIQSKHVRRLENNINCSHNQHDCSTTVSRCDMMYIGGDPAEWGKGLPDAMAPTTIVPSRMTIDESGVRAPRVVYLFSVKANRTSCVDAVAMLNNITR